MRKAHLSSLVLFVSLGLARPANADPYSFSTGNPDGKIATLSRIASPGKLETETADDFVTTALATSITNATFTGLLVGGATTADIRNVEIELYHVFPIDSTNPPDGRVATRTNSPSDNNFAAADGALGQLSFTTKVLNPSFTAANSVVNGIHAKPNQFTGGEGAVTGTEVEFDVTFSTPFLLGPDHVFFRPEVDLGSAGDFLWLSAPKPIVAPGTPFTPDLQSWIRDDGPGAGARLGADRHRRYGPRPLQCRLLPGRHLHQYPGTVERGVAGYRPDRTRSRSSVPRRLTNSFHNDDRLSRRPTAQQDANFVQPPQRHGQHQHTVVVGRGRENRRR